MAVRIVGVDLPQNKRGVIALTYIYGIGRSAAPQSLVRPVLAKTLRLRIGLMMKQLRCVKSSLKTTR